MAESLYPPHSRLFVACDRETTEEELIGEFQHFGAVANVNVCQDRTTGKPKGIAFVQFDKTSEAAAALEALNGAKIGRSSRPVKVTVALAKDQNASSSDQSQFLRLFLVVPKTSTEDDLENYFSQFGEVEFATLVKDRETKQNKGYAYVKFKRFSDAATAYENCDRKYKVVFAKPKEFPLGRVQDAQPSAAGYGHPEPVQGCTHIDDNPEGYTSLRGLVSTDLSDAQVEWLFDIPPGLQFVRFFNEPAFLGSESSYKRKVLAHYDSPGTAAYALRKLDGFGFPTGDKVQVKPDYQYNEMDREPHQAPQQSQLSVSDLMQKIETLNNSLTEATKIINNAGLHAPSGKTIGQIENFRCSAMLPAPQPLAPPNSVTQERLFLVCEPGLPPQDALWDVFSRFGNLIGLYILNGKNCGYAKYASKVSAQRAMKVLNGEDLYRMKLKVMIAEPQRGGTKRPRVN